MPSHALNFSFTRKVPITSDDFMAYHWPFIFPHLFFYLLTSLIHYTASLSAMPRIYLIIISRQEEVIVESSRLLSLIFRQNAAFNTYSLHLPLPFSLFVITTPQHLLPWDLECINFVFWIWDVGLGRGFIGFWRSVVGCWVRVDGF